MYFIDSEGVASGLQLRGSNFFQGYEVYGSRVAFNHESDRFVVTMEHRFVVVRRDGAVFGHEVADGHRISDPFAFEGSRVAFNGDADRFVVTMQCHVA